VCNDYFGCVDWSNSFSTKGMHHVNIRENGVREARLLGEVSILHIPGTSNPADLFTIRSSNLTLHFIHCGAYYYFIHLLSRLDHAPCLDEGY
jgi:hypothetical protein